MPDLFSDYEFLNGAVQIIKAALQAGWYVEWSGNKIVLTYSRKAAE